VAASWRNVLHCSRRNTLPPLRLAFALVGVLCCIVVGDQLHRCASLSYARERAVCIVVGGVPRALFFFFLSLLFANLTALRDIHEAPNIFFVLKNLPACGAWRLRHLESSRIALLFWVARWRSAC
jgi:hypothetical protein